VIDLATVLTPREPKASTYPGANEANDPLGEFAVEAAKQPSEPANVPAPDSDLSVEADAWVESQPFFNPASPAYILKRERPEHRIIVYLKCQGHTYVEIAKRLGWSPPGVANVCKQPWALQLIGKELERAGRNQVEVILSNESINSIMKLIEIRDNPNAQLEVQRKAANDLLDRVYGKPTQPIATTEVDPKELSDVQLAQIAKKALS
jgi:hypothetical protein